MMNNAANTNPIRRLARSQSPLTVAVEILFAIVIVVAFLYSQDPGLLVNALQPDASTQSLIGANQAPNPPSATGGPSLARLAGFDPKSQECQQIIKNGSFEMVGEWVLPLAPRPPAYTDEEASHGNLSLILGIGPSDQAIYSDSQASQIVDLPAMSESLVLMADVWRTASGDSSEQQYLEVLAGPDRYTLFSEQINLPAWQPVVYDLTLLAGSQVEILFGVRNSGGQGKAAMGIDNVRLYACQPLPADSRIGAGAKETATPLDGQGTKENGLFSLLLPFISLVHQPEEPTTQPTATPTASTIPGKPTACTERVINGDFESTDGWTIPNTPRPGRFTTDLAWAGNQSIALGIPPGQANAYSDSTAYQWVNLPADAGQITLRARLWRAGSSNGDIHYVWVAAEGKTTRVLQGLDDGQQWQEISYDLTSLAGKRLFLLLGTYNDGRGGVASMFADSVSILACDNPASPGSATPTPASAPTPEPTSTPTTIASSSHAPPAEMRSPDFGANGFLWWRPEIAHRDLQLIDQAGFRWVRQSFAWEDIQPTSAGFVWDWADQVVAQTNARGLSLVARLGMNPDTSNFWAGRPPVSNAKFVEFVSVLAQRYNCTPQAVGCVQAWQVWNEPNLAREWGGQRPDPAAYANLLGRVYRAIKAANPNALVISAGMAPTGTDNAIAMPDTRFYTDMYRAMGGKSTGYFDLLGVHAPGFAAPPETDPAQAAANPAYGGQRFFAFRHVEDIRAIMVANGDSDKRIAILEFGWTSDPVNPDYAWFGVGAGIDEFVKADYLRRAYIYAAEHWQPWIGLMNVLTMPNLDWVLDGDPFDEEQYWWAILEPSQIDELRLRPAFVGLCVYFRGWDGERCPYAPD